MSKIGIRGNDRGKSGLAGGVSKTGIRANDRSKSEFAGGMSKTGTREASVEIRQLAEVRCFIVTKAAE